MIGPFFILTFVAPLAVYAGQEGRVRNSFTGMSFHIGDEQIEPFARQLYQPPSASRLNFKKHNRCSISPYPQAIHKSTANPAFRNHNLDSVQIESFRVRGRGVLPQSVKFPWSKFDQIKISSHLFLLI